MDWLHKEVRRVRPTIRQSAEITCLLLLGAALLCVGGLIIAGRVANSDRHAVAHLVALGATYRGNRSEVPARITAIASAIPQLKGAFDVPANVTVDFGGIVDVDDKHPIFSPHLRVVNTLVLDNCNITSHAFSKVPEMPHLRIINLAGTAVDDGAVIRLAVLAPEVECVNLEGTYISDVGCAALAKMTNLKCLWLGYCGRVTHHGVMLLSNETLEIDLSGINMSAQVLEKLLNDKSFKSVVIDEPEMGDVHMRRVIRRHGDIKSPLLIVGSSRSIGIEYHEELDSRN